MHDVLVHNLGSYPAEFILEPRALSIPSFLFENLAQSCDQTFRMENQVVDGRYVKKHKLHNLLQQLFPAGDFTVEVRRNAASSGARLKQIQEKDGSFVLTVPRQLTSVGE